MIVSKSLWLPLLIGLEIVIVTVYALTALMNGGEPLPLMDVNGYRTLPSWLQTVQLFLLGALPLRMLLANRQPNLPPSRTLLATIALFFLYAAMDELFKFTFLPRRQQLWKVIYLSIGLTIPLIFRQDLKRLYRMHPKAMRRVAVGIGIFVVGGFGLDWFRLYVQQPYWYQLFGRWQFYQVDAIRTAFEELGEMLGETLVLKGMLMTFAQQRQLSVSKKST